MTMYQRFLKWVEGLLFAEQAHSIIQTESGVRFQATVGVRVLWWRRTFVMPPIYVTVPGYVSGRSAFARSLKG
jgi:hypothetical protein